MKKLYINETQYNSLKRSLLSESQESKSISQAVALVMQRMGYDKPQADNFVRGEIRASFPVLRDKNAGKFILGVTRMFLDNEITNGQTINALNSSIKLLSSDHYNEYDRNLNDLHAKDIIDRFATAVQGNVDNDKKELEGQTYVGDSDYQIVKINSYEEASAFSPYTSWCVTKSPYAFNNYTSDGVGQFYFCLKKGWQEMQEVEGDNCPLDEYGLSMIAVCVDGQGALQSCTCRWNHNNGGDDNIMSTKEISQVIGQNFYNVFKPNNFLEELKVELKTRFQNGESYNDLFALVQAFGKHSLVGQLKRPRKWGIFSDKCELLSALYSDIESRLNKEVNNLVKTMIDPQGYYHIVDDTGKDYAEGIFINDCWVEDINDNDYIHCKIGSYDDGVDLHNFFNPSSKEWLFDKNVGKVETHTDFPYIVIDDEMGKENLFNPETKTLVFDKWYTFIYPHLWFKTFFLVRDSVYDDGSSNRKENLYDISKKSFVFDEWVDEIDWPNSYGDIRITINDKKNLYDLYNQRYITDLWFNDMWLEQVAICVENDEGYNILNNERTDVAYPVWFDKIKADGYSKTSGLLQAKYNGTTWWINKSGRVYLWDKQKENFKQIPLENLLNYDKNDVQESVNMNKKVIMTESQFASLRNLLLIEAATIQDIQSKYYPNIDLNIMRQILSQGDPTYRQEKPDKMGKYGKWLLWLYQNRQLKLEDLYKAKEYLSYFIKFAQKIEDKDINHYKTLPQLYLTVKPFMDDPTQASSHQDEIRMAKEGAEKVYEDDVWLIVVPHTEEAAKYYGKNTQWCTAADGNNYFNHYNSQGPLYININKADNEKYQFHFESDQFMDETDTPIEEPIIENIPITSGAIAWHRENVDQWQMLQRQKIDFYVKDGIEANFCKYPETDWWLEDGSGNKIMENLRDVDIFIDQIWSEMNSNGWSDIPCTEGGSKLLVLSYGSRYINGRNRAVYELENLGGPYSSIECLTDDYGDEYMYKIFKCVKSDGRVIVKGQNDYHFNTFNASEINDIFMYGDVIFYEFEDGQYIIQNMDDDEFNTVQIPERFEGQLNYDEWPYMYWIYTDNGHEMKINMETFDYRYLHADNYDENEDF